MKKYGRTDANQTKIVEALRKVGYSVESLASLGEGIPDIIVGAFGNNYLFEIKVMDEIIKERVIYCYDCKANYITANSGVKPKKCGRCKSKNIDVVEIKEDKPRKLTKDEHKFHKSWSGQVAIIYSFEDAINKINNYRSE